MNHNFAHRTGLAAAAATALLAGTTQSLAADVPATPPEQQPTQQPGASHGKRSAQAEITIRQMKRELGKLTKRLIAGLEDLAATNGEAIDELADAEPTDDDVQSLVDSIDGGMNEALAGATGELESRAAKYLKKMMRKKASDGQMRRANAIVQKLGDSIDEAYQDLVTELEQQLTSAFPETDITFDEDEEEIDDGDDTPPDAQPLPPDNEQPENPEVPHPPTAWPPNPPFGWPVGVAYPPNGAPADYPPGHPPAGWPADRAWPPQPAAPVDGGDRLR